MDVTKTFDVISSGLSAERTRIDAISSNVANANSVRSADGKGPYRRKDVVLQSVPHQPSFGEILDEKNSVHSEVQVIEVHEDTSEPRKVYDPNHPEADAEGYVAMPNVNPVEEMANMISANRAYQADANLFQTTKQMALKALEIGR